MLTHLALKNFVLIDALSLDVGGGLSVITGETGAGKSILLAGLGLVTGARVQGGMIGGHGDRAEVSAQFQLPDGHPTLALLAEQELESEDGALVLRRTIGKDGRTKAFVNGASVPVAMLGTLGANLVEIQGQFDQLAILNPRNHRPTLDEAGNLLPLVSATTKAHERRDVASKALAAETERLKTLSEEEDYMRHSLAELESANLMAGEAEELSERRQALRSLSDAAEALSQLSTVLNGDKGITGQLAKATKLISRLPNELAQDLDPMIRSLDQAWNASESASNDLNSKLHELGDAERDLEDASERLFHLKDLARKHSCQPDELPAKELELRETLKTLDQGQDQLRAMARELTEAKAAYLVAATKLSQARHKSGKHLAAAINAELPGLMLPNAQVNFQIEGEADEQGGPQGFDKVRLMVATNKGSQPGPLDKVASGGELSRILLALKLALAPETGPGALMVFDEADAGVGGATAAALGARLRALAETTQVLAVTHSPQLAAAGSQHLKVYKSDKDGRTGSTLRALEDGERIPEIARMLAGAEVGPEAISAAQKLRQEVQS